MTKKLHNPQLSIGAVDLFCGVGGLTSGLQSAGIDVVAGIDMDETCRYAYTSNNHHSSFINRDIRAVSGEEINELLSSYDIKVLVGCAPCQPFSSHRKDKSHRSLHKDWGLLAQFGRLISDVMPEYVSMENVPELAKESIFDDFLKVLREHKYEVEYRIVKTEEYGLPQRRRRLILLAAQGKQVSLIPPPSVTGSGLTVQSAIGNLPPVHAGEHCPTDPLHTASNLSNLNLQRIRASRPNGSWRDWPDSLRLKCHKKATGKTYSSVYGRMAWNKPAPTITTQFYCYGTGRFGHPEQDRALTLREGAILQGFPRNYTFIDPNRKLSRKEIARHIGNAVPPKLGKVIGESILNSCKYSFQKEEGNE